MPKATTAVTQLRRRGHGLPRDDGTRGNLYATVRIHTPDTVTSAERTRWEQLAALATFPPRSAS